jgi:hypothetical protein
MVAEAPLAANVPPRTQTSPQNSMPRFFREFIEGCIQFILNAHKTIEQQVKLHNARLRLIAIKTQTSTY